MAATHYSPTPTGIEDPVTYKEASALLARTGHRASPETIARWVRDDQLETERVGRKDQVSWTAVLEAHFRRTAVKLRASADWP